MNKFYNNIEELIGNTPLIKLNKLIQKFNLKANIYAKLEYFNPAGSIKDRVALYMINDAEKSGTLTKGGTIIEPTSGNTGIGLALIAAVRGYKAIIIMPDTMSQERISLMKAYGAQVVLTEGKLGMQGTLDKAQEINEATPNSIIIGQFENPSNPQAHIETTGPEIYDALDGKIDYFVAGVGTGGTITGCGKFLKSKIDNIKVIAVEPDSSPLLSKGIAGPHKIQGIGANFIPKNLDTSIYDSIFACKNEDAINTAKLICKEEGILVGISSGAALFAAIELAKQSENENKNIVVILPDTGSRYLSTGIFDE